MQDIIIMSNRELHCVEILQKLIDKRLTEHEAAKQLDLSVRQIRRLKKAYKVDGAIGIVSKKRGKPSNHIVFQINNFQTAWRNISADYGKILTHFLHNADDFTRILHIRFERFYD